MRSAAGLAPVPSAPKQRPLRVGLVGNPNCGKSTLFNALTGRRQRVANFPGVTVDRAEGEYRHDDTAVAVIDLPGMYSLSPESPDETIAVDVLLGCAEGVDALDVIVLVVDAEHLERNLYLATEVLELGRPTVIALNRVDRLERGGIRIDVVELIHELGVVVVPVMAVRGEGVDRLRHAIARAASLPRSPLTLMRGAVATPGASPDTGEADRRYRWIAGVLDHTVTRTRARTHALSDRVDAVVLHRVWGPVIFLGLMLLVFQAMFSWARPLAAGIQFLVSLSGAGVRAAVPPGQLRSLLVDGALGGVGSVLVFLPQIAILFLFIGLLEDSGYMARAAFVMDRYMRPLGLHGKSFIPLISGYACAVPAIMATRTIQHPKERMATIMVVPLMSCSARLPVYTLLVGAFVPAVAVAGVAGLQGLTMLGMYLLGTVAALAAAAVFRRTLLRSDTRALIIELPPYSLPERAGAGQFGVAARAAVPAARRHGDLRHLHPAMGPGQLSAGRRRRRARPITQEQRLSRRRRWGGWATPSNRPCAPGLRLEDRRVDDGVVRRPRGVRVHHGHDLRRVARRHRYPRPRPAAARGARPGHGRPGLHAAARDRPHGVLRVRPDVHQHRDHHPPRDGRRLARGGLGAITIYIYAGAGLRRGVRHLPRRPRPGPGGA